MTPEMLERDDLSVYVIAGVPRSFRKTLQKFVEQESKSDGELMLLSDEMADWVIAKLRGEKRRSYEQTPASAALWRAYRALSAARYHLQEREEAETVRELRNQVEILWRQVSPLYRDEPAEEEKKKEGD